MQCIPVYTVQLQCTVYSVQCTVYSVQCTVYSVQCTVYSVQCTVYSVQCTVYSVQCTVYSVQCTVYRYGSVVVLHSTPYSVHCTVYAVQCTPYSVRCTLYSVRWYFKSISKPTYSFLLEYSLARLLLIILVDEFTQATSTTYTRITPRLPPVVKRAWFRPLAGLGTAVGVPRSLRRLRLLAERTAMKSTAPTIRKPAHRFLNSRR